MNVLTSAFSAEYGRTTGGAINLVTKSGTSNVHVDATGLYRPGSLSADQPVTGTSGYDNLWQGSGIISGPIVADRVYFSVGGEYNAGNRDSTITSPLDPGVYRGESQQSLAFARIDADLNDQNHAFGKFTGQLAQRQEPAGRRRRRSRCRAPAANSPATRGRRSWRTRRASRPRSSTTCA